MSLFPLWSPYAGFTCCVFFFLPGSLAGSLALSVAYGLNVESENDRFYAASGEAMNAASMALLPGAFLVDSLPIRMSPTQKKEAVLVLRAFVLTVKYVPEWFPGAGFQRFARLGKRNIDDSVNLPFQHVKESFQVRKLYLSCERRTGRNCRRTLSQLLLLWQRV